MLVTMKKLLDAANQEGYAVVAPNAWNEDSVKAVIRAAEKMKSPVIMALYPVMADIEDFAAIAKYYIEKTALPIALHLDHSAKYEDAMKALRSGFSSVMVDRSQLAYSENVREVAEIVKAAHALGVTVEAELGHVGQGVEYEATRDAGLTHPEEAEAFIRDTGVDCLAVAVGTSHGVYKGVPKIDFERLETIKKRVGIPLVLHGSSGTGDANLAKCVELGINKINLFTDLNLSADGAIRTRMTDASRADIVSVCELLYNEYERELIRNMKLVGSDNRIVV